MRTIISAICVVIGIPMAHAWTVTTERDRMTDRELTWASATSGGATLLVGCLNGSVQARLVWNERKGWGSRIGVSWRMDNGPMEMTAGGLFSEDGTTLYPWIGRGVGELRKARRVRVMLGREVLDFDLAKGDPWPERWGKC